MLFFVSLKEYLLHVTTELQIRVTVLFLLFMTKQKKKQNGGVSNDIISKQHQGGFIILMSTSVSGYEEP
jgi:hypothetical protein